MSRIFISYSHADGHVVVALRRDLESWGHVELFVDRDPHRGIPAGADWVRTIGQAIHGAQVVLAICSAHSQQSRWCLAETVLAQSAAVPVIPVRIDETEVEAHLAALQSIRYSPDDTSALRDALLAAQVHPGAAPTWNPQRSPFGGLDALTREDAAVFFGREAELDQFVRELDRERQGRDRGIVVVHGASGVGKSSFVSAGVLPRIEAYPELWAVRPPVRRYDDRRLTGLEQELLGLERSGAPGSGPGPAHPESRPVLVLDQVEALLAVPDRERVDVLLHRLERLCAGPDPDLLLIVILRSDAHPALAARAEIGDSRARTVPTGPLDRAALVRVIEGPAERARLRVQKGLAHRMAEETGTGANLPLLAYVLREMDGHRDGSPELTTRLYEDVGGIAGALEQQARNAVQPDERPALHRMFARMVAATDHPDVFVGRPVPWPDVPQGAHRAVSELIDRRVLRRHEETVELAHESLITLWPDLRDWVDAHHAYLRWRRSFRTLFAAWKAGDGADADVLRGRQLDEAVRWLEERPADLTSAEADFVRTSRQRDLDERAERRDLHRRSEALRLAALAEAVVNERFGTDAPVAVHLAATSLRLLPTLEGDQAMRAALGLAPRVHVRVSHSQSLAAASPCGRYWAAVGDDAVVRVHGCATGEEVGRFAHPPPPVEEIPEDVAEDVLAWMVVSAGRQRRGMSAVAFSGDGGRIVSADESGRVYVRAVDALRTVVEYQHSASVTAVALDPTGAHVASVDADGIGVVVRVDGAEVIGRARLRYAGSAAAFAPQGGEVALGSVDGEVVRVRFDASGVTVSAARPAGRIAELTYSPDGEVIATAGDGVHLVADTAVRSVEERTSATRVRFGPAGRTLVVAHGHRVTSVYGLPGGDLRQSARIRHFYAAGTALAISGDGRSVAVGHNGGAVFVFDADDGEEQARFWVEGDVLALAFLGDDRLLAVSKGAAVVVDARARAELARVEMRGGVGTIGLHDGGPGHVYAAGSDSGELCVVAGDRVRRIEREGPIHCVAVAPSGDRVAAGGDDGRAVVLDVATGAVVTAASHAPWPEPVTADDGPVRLIAVGPSAEKMVHDVLRRGQRERRSVRSVAFTGDGRRLLSAGGDGTCAVVDIAGGAVVARFAAEKAIGAACLGRSGRLVAFATDHMLSVRVVAPLTGSAGAWDTGLTQELTHLAFSPDERFLVACDVYHTVVYDAVSGSVVLGDGEDAPRSPCAAFDGTGRLLAVGGWDCHARLYDTGTWQEIAEFRHASQVFAVAVSADGRRLATGTDIRFAHVWDVASGRELARLEHDGAVNGVLFGPHGRTLLTASQDGTARLWPVEPSLLLDEAGRRATEPLLDGELARYGLRRDGDRYVSKSVD